jgi:hypothetical protein
LDWEKDLILKESCDTLITPLIKDNLLVEGRECSGSLIRVIGISLNS